MTMKLLKEDNGNCRVYYREEHRLYCWQEDSKGNFVFYVCSSDGEPSHEVDKGYLMPLPHGETSIGEDLREFLEWKRAVSTLGGF